MGLGSKTKRRSTTEIGMKVSQRRSN